MNQSAGKIPEQLHGLAAIGRASARRSDLVAFLGRGRGSLMDNVKYLYLHAVAQGYGFESVFLCKREEEHRLLAGQGLPVLPLDRRSINVLTSAGVLVMDDLPMHNIEACCLGAGALQLQLWHGIPLKQIGFPELESTVNMTPDKAAALAWGYSAADVVLSTSDWVTRTLFSKVFQAPVFVEFGYPRNDILLREAVSHDFLNCDMACYDQAVRHKERGGKVVVYMPTWRDSKQDFLDEDGHVVIDGPSLEAFAAERDVLFVLKLHPYMQDERVETGPVLLRHASDKDIYPLLPLADALVTDYSAAYFDFLLLDRPILFFAYDLERYRCQDRALFFPYETMAPGPICRTQAELLEVLGRVLDGQDDHGKERETLRNRVFDHRDAGASERLCRYIQDVMLPAVARKA